MLNGNFDTVNFFALKVNFKPCDIKHKQGSRTRSHINMANSLLLTFAMGKPKLCLRYFGIFSYYNALNSNSYNLQRLHDDNW